MRLESWEKLATKSSSDLFTATECIVDRKYIKTNVILSMAVIEKNGGN
jgi:hypothetical protein